jgi:hypothetical protein
MHKLYIGASTGHKEYQGPRLNLNLAKPDRNPETMQFISHQQSRFRGCHTQERPASADACNARDH